MASACRRSPNLKWFACEYVSKGEKLVAVDTVYEFNDRYYIQWLATNVPFRSLDELWDEDVERLVPSSYKYLATTLRICADKDRVPCEFHNLFLDEDKLKNYMKAAAKTEKFVNNVHGMIVGQRGNLLTCASRASWIRATKLSGRLPKQRSWETAGRLGMRTCSLCQGKVFGLVFFVKVVPAFSSVAPVCCDAGIRQGCQILHGHFDLWAPCKHFHIARKKPF